MAIRKTIMAVMLAIISMAVQAQAQISPDLPSYDSTTDSIAFILPDSLMDMPESFSYNIDSLMQEWWASRYLIYDDECILSNANPQVSDSVMAMRLAAMPTIVEMPFNSITRNSIDRYMGSKRRIVSYSIGMMPLYEDIFVNALMKYNVPLELRYLPIVESALKPSAYSRAGAAGMWQFIYSTGRKYGLVVNSLIDDRYDVVKESDAAAHHLSDLYNLFGRWDLAISAYNCGAGNVTKAITRSGGKTDFWSIYPYLPRETRGYLPAFIAVNYAMEYYRDHGVCPMESSMPDMMDTLVINRNLHYGQIMHYCDITKDELKALNPQYLTDVIPGSYRPCTLTLPLEHIRPILEAGDSIYEFDKEKYFPSASLKHIDDDMNNRLTYITHKIVAGETLGSIAKKYHTTVKNIKSWNNLTSDNIRAGKTLKIYNR